MPTIISENVSKSTLRKRKQRTLDKNAPERKHRKLDTIYMFGCVDVSVLIDNNGSVWFKGVDLARALELEDPNHAIRDTLDIKYLKSYNDLMAWVDIPYRDIPGLQPQTTFVNETGMNMFILRSRMPKAEKFAEWVCGEVLPSIRKTNKYETTPDQNPMKELNDFLKARVDELKLENKELKDSIAFKDRMLEKNNNDISTLTTNIFNMKPTCILKNTNKLKDEYCLIYKKSPKSPGDIDDAETLLYPYYACRIQDDSVNCRLVELKSTYPDLVELRRYKTPNSVNFFNYIIDQLPTILERGKHKHIQSFRIKNSDTDESSMLTIIDNIYRVNYGK